ncbi:glycerol-3-phosphate dehydrogenase/oxidase [Acidimicrobiia bacterium EGI L10123]|uniref:glycerol-3-phosphate dehydrogenase/oxidase n=1 Tax=Salinilacustrithrix flava TaxID=2957203 RepID=UPI003D7C3222|nr:glycerol-3-phosphate dehydrogenase/oxidase [Acidimicrobiia bacterium EGI L10123]
MDARQREQDLARMRDEIFDIVVIGGGVTGAGVALDAATRGLSVALVEQRDFAAGTSSRSSKLFHGGLRYLEQLELGLVTEALHERNLMLNRLCPHLARPVTFLYPLTHRVWERAYVGAGIALYDALAAFGSNPLPRHRHLSKRAARRLVPSLRDDVLTGAITYSDAQVDDARHTMSLVRTAHHHGAAVAASVQVVDLLREGGRVTGVRARDVETNDELDIRGRQTVNATGVWTDEIQDMAGGATLRVRASKGVHLVVPRDRIDAGAGLICRTPTSVLFVIPWGDFWLVGTTDTDWNLDLARPAASAADLDYLLGQVNRWLRPALTHADIVGVYAGLRPLLHGESDSTSKLSREHAVTTVAPGLLSVAGGKYTTYRVMAADAVDAAVAAMGVDAPASCTESVPLVGATGYEAMRNRREQLAAESGLPVERIDRLLGRYGSELPVLLELLRTDPAMAECLPGTDDYLAAEARFAVDHEGALHLDDVLTRRTRLSIESPDRGVSAARVVAGIMADVLGWDEATVAREIDSYDKRVEAERQSQQAVDDHTADARRLGAEDVRGTLG